TGKNFGAGMSGGLAFVFDADGRFEQRINPAMIGLERLGDEEETASLRKLITIHANLTGSRHARALLEDWGKTVAKFWKVVPHPPTPATPKAVYVFDGAKAPLAV